MQKGSLNKLFSHVPSNLKLAELGQLKGNNLRFSVGYIGLNIWGKNGPSFIEMCL